MQQVCYQALASRGDLMSSFLHDFTSRPGSSVAFPPSQSVTFRE